MSVSKEGTVRESRGRFLRRVGAAVAGLVALPVAGAQRAVAATASAFDAVRISSADAGQSLLHVRADHAFPWGTEGTAPRPILLDNTGNPGPGMSIFSANRQGGNGRLLALTAADPAFDGAALHVAYEGSGHAVTIDHGEGRPGAASAQALSVVSRNPADTTAGVRGRQVGRGTLKVTHEKPRGARGNDAAAAAVSVKLEGAGTAAKGIFVDSAPATSGRLADVRNGGDHMFLVEADGRVWVRALGVGNAERAGSVGRVTGRMEVFDYAGNSLGYVAIHAA
jgi:hypothetical protein